MYAGVGGPIAVSGLGAADEEPEEELPTRAEVKAGYKEWLAIAPRGFPADNMTPDAAVGWSLEALDSYARSQGINTQSNQHIDMRNFVASANQGRGFDPSQAATLRYSGALGEMSAAVGLESEYPGVAVELGVVTYETLKDGKLSQSDAVKIGQVTGAVVGGVVAQAFGVPAPIGAMAGAALGGGAAAIVHSAFAGPDIQAQLEAAERALQAEMERFRSDAIYRCTGIEGLYWKEFDRFYDSFAVAWTKAEQSVGWRFDLRWFDPNPGLEFRYTWNRAKRSYTDSPRTDTLGVEYACGTQAVYHSGGRETITTCKYKCPFVYGCPYPYLGPGAVPSQVVPDALTGNASRVSQAFAARGALWLPETERLSCEEHIARIPHGAELAPNYQIRKKYQSDVRTQLWVLEQKIQKLQRVRSLLGADLLRTLTVVRAERDLYVNRVSYLTDGWQRGAYELAIQKSSKLSSVLNNTMLAAGAGLLGYGIYRAVR